MVDVMESYNCDDKVADPSTWSLGTAPTTSSFSTKSGSSPSYSFLNDVNSNKLRTIPETNCHIYDISSNSASSCSSASSTPKSIGFQSINVQNEDQSSTSALGLSLSTTSSQSTKSGTNFFSALLKSGSNVKERGMFTSNTSDSSGRSFNFLKNSKTSAACKELSMPNVTTSKKQLGFKLLPNSPKDRMSSTKSDNTSKRSRSVERSKSGMNCYSKSDIMNQRAYSFDLPSSHGLHSSPTMSPACSRNMLSERGKLICASLEDIKDIQSTSSILQQREYGHNQARSFDLPSNLEMYTSPAQSLPTPSMVTEPHSLNMDEEKFFVQNDFTIRESNFTCSKSSTAKQQQGKWRDKALSLRLEQSMPNAPTQYIPTTLSTEKTTKLHFEKDHTANECFNAINKVLSDTSATEPSEQSLEECSSIDRIRTESYEEETKDLSLLTEVRNSFDDKSQVDSVSVSTESLSVCTQDAILADFLEEAIFNINGEEKYNIANVLREMRDVAKIESIEDLILSNNKALLFAFADKELVLEMRRLLEEPEYEAQFQLESIYENDDYLCISGVESAAVLYEN